MAVVDDAFLENLARNRSGNFWLGGLIGLAALGYLLSWFDDTTVLTPNHAGTMMLCFIVAVLMCLVSAVVGFRSYRAMGMARRILRGIGYGLVGLLTAFLAMMGATTIIMARIDFPPGKIHAYQRLMAISRAYRTHGRSRSWVIQTIPFVTTLDITANDYDFMLAHRRPGDDARDEEQIASKGYFCARVTIEQAGDALRVMHAGSYTLPPRTVIVCPGKEGTILQKPG